MSVINTRAGDHATIPGLTAVLAKVVPMLQPELDRVVPGRIRGDHSKHHRKSQTRQLEIEWRLQNRTRTGWKMVAVGESARQNIYFVTDEPDALLVKIQRILVDGQMDEGDEGKVDEEPKMVIERGVTVGSQEKKQEEIMAEQEKTKRDPAKGGYWSAENRLRNYGGVEPWQKLGKKMRELREQKGVTASQVADLMGLNPTTVRTWEKGLAPVHTSHITRYFQILGVPLSAIEGYIPPMAGAVLTRDHSKSREKKIRGEKMVTKVVPEPAEERVETTPIPLPKNRPAAYYEKHTQPVIPVPTTFGQRIDVAMSVFSGLSKKEREKIWVVISGLLED